MDEQKKEDEQVKPLWQMQKESWYDHVPLTVKQLDWIIRIALGLLVLVFILIGLDAAGVI